MKLGPDPRFTGTASLGLPEKVKGIQTKQGHKDVADPLDVRCLWKLKVLGSRW